MLKKKVVIITTGQPSTNPRMVKEYMALKQAGYRVKVIYSYWAQWALNADKAFFDNPLADKSDFVLAGGSVENKKHIYFLSRVMHKASKYFSNWLPKNFLKYAEARVTFFLISAALKYDTDIYIAHNLGALPAAVIAAKKKKVLCGFDMEDAHSGQHKDQQSPEYKSTKYIEDSYLPRCNYITFSSKQIEHLYRNQNITENTAVIRNVIQADEVITSLYPVPAHPLKLAWFSQQIGEERGIETVIEAINKLPAPVELHLLGNSSPDYKTKLYNLINKKEQLFFHLPVAANAIVGFLKDKHIGLATETGRDINNNAALSNKLFTYLGAGNMLIATDTTAQEDFLTSYPAVGSVYKKNNAAALLEILQNLVDHPEIIIKYRSAALHLAQTCLNWDTEKEGFIKIMSNTLNKH